MAAGLNAQNQAARPFPRPGAPLLSVAGRNVEVRVIPVTERTARIAVLPVDSSGAAAALPDEPVVVARHWAAPVIQVRSRVPAAASKAGTLTVEVRTDAGVEVSVAGPSGVPPQQFRIAVDTGALSFRIGEQPLLGLGQGGPRLDRRGIRQPMTPGETNLATDGMRVPVPWLISPEGWAVFVNRPKGEFDLTGAEGIYRPLAAESGALIDLFVSMDREPAGLMKEYAGITGLPTMPPLWSLGYQQSHRTLLSREHVFGIARRLREDKLPTDVLIYLGTGWAPSGWNEWHGSFDFKKDVFPTPDKDIQELRAMNFKVILHAVGNPERLYGTVRDTPLPVPDLNQVVQYWKTHQAVSKMIDGWWPDASERPDDASRLARIRMYWEGSQLDHPGVRPYALHRTGYAGMQRYGGWLWSGDVNATWQTLKTHIATGINTSMSGIPCWGTDIGGFFSTKELTGELFVRWFQFGAFCPLFRSHGRPSQTRFPWGWNTGEIGPPEMDTNRPGLALPDISELHNAQVEPVCQKYLNLRYRLMPYLYSLVAETHETGVPVMRALMMYYGDDAQAVARGDEYLWGRDILVAPVVEKGATARVLYLPKGDWYDFWSGERRQGGAEITRKVDLETMPLYVRAGAIVPMGPVKQYTAEKSTAPLSVRVFPGANGSFVLYDDDGTSFAFEKGEFMRARMDWDDGARQLRVSLVSGSKMVGGAKELEIELAPQGTKRRVKFDGKALSVRF